MATKTPMKKVPGKKPIDLEGLDEFAAAANGEPAEKAKEQKEVAEASPAPETGPFPWEKEDVSELILKPFNLRVNQVQIEKLKYVVKNTPGFNSVHAFCMDAVLKRMDEELKKLLG